MAAVNLVASCLILELPMCWDITWGGKEPFPGSGFLDSLHTETAWGAC